MSLFLSSRLCGKVPFYDTSVPKLNELIRAGKLDFSEPQWATISEAGTYSAHGVWCSACVAVGVGWPVCCSGCGVACVLQWVWGGLCVAVGVGWPVCCSGCGVACVLQWVWGGLCVAVGVGWPVCCSGCGVACELQWVWSGLCVAVGVGWPVCCSGCGVACVLVGVVVCCGNMHSLGCILVAIVN